MLDNIILHEMCIGHVFENTILLGTCIAMWVLSNHICLQYVGNPSRS